MFDKEFRCAFDLLATIPTEAYPNISVAEQFFTFNNEHPFVDQTHIVDRELRPLRGPRYGLSLGDGLALARLSLTSEERLDGRRIEEFFPKPFFDTEFWLLWSTIMGSLPQHSLIEFRRYMNRFVYLFPDLSTMAHVLRSQFNQHEAFVKPLVAWLRQRDVNFVTGAVVQDLAFNSSPGRLTVNRLDYERRRRRDLHRRRSGRYRAGDDRLAGGRHFDRIDEGRAARAAPSRAVMGVVEAVWLRAHKGFGNPDAFFGADRIADSRWVTFTITTKGKEILDEMTALTRSGPGSGGLLTLKDSNWVISLSIFDQPEVLEQPPDVSVLWGYGLYPERKGNRVRETHV